MRIFAFIHCYKVAQQFEGVVDHIGPEVESSLKNNLKDRRVTVIYNLGNAILSFLSYDLSFEPKFSLQQFWVR